MADAREVSTVEISLKNTNGNGPRGVIDAKGNHHVIPVGGEEADIEVDEYTAQWLVDAWENGGDLEVTSGAPAPTKRKKNKERSEPVPRATLT